MNNTPREAAAARLHQQLADFERDARTLTAELVDVEADCASLEAAAIDAVRRGEDGAASNYAREFELRSDEAARISAEITVIEATVQSYREVLNDPKP